MNINKLPKSVLLFLFFFQPLLGEGSKNMKTDSLSFHENFNIASANNYSSNATVEGRGKKWFYASKYLLPAKSKLENDEYIQYPYRVDIGLNNNFLLSSDILKKGYSGFGIFIEPYIGKYISFKFKLNRWIISSLKEDPDYTPFHKTSLWKKYYLLKLNIYPWNQVIFAQFGIIGPSKNEKYSGGIREGGFNYGFGCHLYSFNNFYLSLTVDNNFLGRIDPGGGNIWDTNKEICVGISYSIKGIRRIKK